MNNILKKLKIFSWVIYIYINYIYKYTIYMYTCLLIDNIDFFERATVSIFGELGEWYVEEFWSRLNFSIFFYSTLWYLLRRKVENKFELLKLEYIWKIKRSNNSIIKKIAKFLTKYDWFNNTIIRF